MEDDVSEEFIRFIRDNRDTVLRILNEGDEEADLNIEQTYEDIKSRTETDIKKISNDVLRVLSDSEVQQHFMTGCMELLLCFESMIKAMPLSDSMKDVVDNMEKTKNVTIRNVAKTGAKVEAKSALEKISISNIKDKLTGNDS